MRFPARSASPVARSAPPARYYRPNPIGPPRGSWRQRSSFQQERPLERFLKDASRGSYLRLEYLLWDIEDPGSTLLGAPIDGIENPRELFPVADPTTGEILGEARVPDLADMAADANNGIRGTLGIPLSFADFEVRAFGLEQSTDTESVDLPDFTEDDTGEDVRILAATSTRVDGEIATNLQLYDERFDATFRSQLWGGDAKFVFPAMGQPGEGFKLKPLIGFQYLNLQESLQQVGVFNDLDDPANNPNLKSEIHSSVQNNLYGPVLGARAELQHRWFTIGAEPKIGLAANSFQAEVRTENFRGPGDPTVTTEEDETVFSPVFELGVYGRAHLSETFSFHIGYNLIWAAQVSRPDKNIFYNDRGPLPTPPAVVVDSSDEDILIDGLTIGGEIRFK